MTIKKYQVIAVASPLAAVLALLAYIFAYENRAALRKFAHVSQPETEVITSTMCLIDSCSPVFVGYTDEEIAKIKSEYARKPQYFSVKHGTPRN